MVDVRRHQQWMIYSLPASPALELEVNLKCLQDCMQTEPLFKKDRVKLKKVMGSKSVSDLLDEGCCVQPKKLSLKGR